MTTLDLAMIQAIDERIRKVSVERIQYGTVVERTFDDSAQVAFDGSSQALPVKVFGGVEAYPGDRVGAVKFGGFWILVGSMTHRWPATAGTSQPQGAGGTTTSSTYSAVPVDISFAFTKRWNLTRVRCVIMGSAFSATAGSEVEAGLNFSTVGGNTTYDIAYHVYNTSGEHGPFHGLKYLAGGTSWSSSTLPAGDYTVQLLWRRALGTGTLTVNNGDKMAAFVDEVAP